jgi:hypothetical protein
MAKKPLSELLNGVTRFGRFTVIGEAEPIPRRNHPPERRALCRCDCGNTASVQPANLKSGRSASCGCLAAELARVRRTKHGGSGTTTYKSWAAMTERCLNPKHHSFPRYGALGIAICDEWQGEDGFVQFLADMGERPNGTTLDRIRNNEGYEPSNCRWATPKRQQNNRECNTRLTLNGVTMTQREWTDLRGWGKNVISERLRKGWNVERALTKPVAERARSSEP